MANRSPSPKQDNTTSKRKKSKKSDRRAQTAKLDKFINPIIFAALLIASLVYTAIRALILLGTNTDERVLLERGIQDPASVLYSELAASDQAQIAAGNNFIFALLVSGFFLILWFAVVYGNSRAFNPKGGLRYAIPWAIFGWVVPIFNFIRPLDLALDAWNASDPDVDVSNTYDWHQGSGTNIVVNAWWFIRVGISLIVAYVFITRGGPSNSLNSLLTRNTYLSFALYFVLLSITIDCLFIIALTGRQMNKYSKLNPDQS